VLHPQPLRHCPGPQLDNIPWWSKNAVRYRRRANIHLGEGKDILYNITIQKTLGGKIAAGGMKPP